MRPLLLGIVANIGLVLGAAATVSAQEATPSTPRTDVRFFLPYFRGELVSELTVAGNASGVCSLPSLADIGRPDAWACTDSTSREFYDPCFENPEAAPNEHGELACLESPFSTEVVLFTLTEPLTRTKRFEVNPSEGGRASSGTAETPGRKEVGGMTAAPAQPMAIEQIVESAVDSASDGGTLANPLDIPWALELTNGERCTFQTNSTTVLAGERVNYECTGGGFILGEVDRDLQVWTVSYVANGSGATTLVDLTVAWT